MRRSTLEIGKLGDERDRLLNTLELFAPLLLASASPRRAQILSRAGLAFQTAPANIDEAEIQSPSQAEERARVLAAAKARWVAARCSRGMVVLGADTLVVRDETILEKPRDEDEARRMLRSLRGRVHQVITGVAIAGDLGESAVTEVTQVRFRDYTDGEIESYLASGAPMDKAGAYGIQDHLFSPAERVRGCYSNVVGLPLCRTVRLLREKGAIRYSVHPALLCEGHNRIGAST